VTARIALGTAFLGLALGAGADEIKGTFQFGKIRFTPTEALAYQVEGKEPGKPVTVVVLTDFKIDRPAALAAIDTAGGIMGQIFTRQSGNAVFVTLATEGQCGVGGFFEGSRSVGLGEDFTATTKTATSSRVAGSCATDKPGQMFDDAYEFRLTYDVPPRSPSRPRWARAGARPARPTSRWCRRSRPRTSPPRAAISRTISSPRRPRRRPRPRTTSTVSR